MDLKILYGPPGTGKSTTLLRIVERERQTTPLSRIAYVTFTKKATEEIQERMVRDYQVPMEEMMHIRTIHSMCFRDVQASKERMMSPHRYAQFGKKAGFSIKGYFNVDEGFQGADDDFIGLDQLYRNNRRAAGPLMKDVNSRRFVNFLTLYKQYKDTFGFLDFTDLLQLYLQHDLTCDVDVAIVDEAQDLTTLQWQVIFKAFKNVKTLYIAGDDDQAIYTFGGADVGAFLKLRGDSHVLSHSYRLPQNFVDAAAKISARIIHRACKEYRGLDRRGTLERLENIGDLSLSDTGTVMMLARNNYHLAVFKDYCMAAGLPFTVKGKPFFSATDLKRIVDKQGVQDWEPLKIDYANRLLENDMLFTEPRINISTIHGVKGGEADHVIIGTDVSKAVMKQLDRDPDSEHRVFYVGFTRAKERVTVVLPQTRYSYDYLMK